MIYRLLRRSTTVAVLILTASFAYAQERQTDYYGFTCLEFSFEGHDVDTPIKVSGSADQEIN